MTSQREKGSKITLPHAHTEQHKSFSCQEAPSRPRGVINDFKQDGKRLRDGRERVMQTIMSSCDTTFL